MEKSFFSMINGDKKTTYPGMPSPVWYGNETQKYLFKNLLLERILKGKQQPKEVNYTQEDSKKEKGSECVSMHTHT